MKSKKNILLAGTSRTTTNGYNVNIIIIQKMMSNVKERIMNEKEKEVLLYSENNGFGNADCLYMLYGHLFKDIDLENTLLVYNKYWNSYEASDLLQKYTKEMFDLRKDLAIAELSKLNNILTSKEDLKASYKEQLQSNIKQLSALIDDITKRIEPLINSTVKHFLNKLELNIKEEVFEDNKLDSLFNTVDGIIDLKTGKLIPHSSEYMLNYMVDIPYNPDNRYDYSLWDQQLSELIVNYNQPEVKEFIQILFGYLLIGGNREKKSIFLTGERDSGKSLFINILDKLFGELFGKLPFNAIARDRSKTNDQGFDLAETRFKRVLAVSEPDRNASYNASLIKDISGREKISAAKKGKQPKLIQPKFKLVIASNFDLVGDILDPAFFGRFIIIPVFKGYTTMDLNREDDLLINIEGILHWFVQGAVKYYQLGKLPNTPKVLVDALNEMIIKQDTVLTFLNDCEYKISDSVNDLVPFNKLYEDYEEWCLDNIERPLYKREFTQYFTTKGCKNIRATVDSKQVRCINHLSKI